MKKININDLKYILSESIKMLNENETSEDRYGRQVSKIDKYGNPLEYTVYYIEDPDYVETDYGENGNEDINNGNQNINLGIKKLPSTIKTKNRITIRNVFYVIYDSNDTILDNSIKKDITTCIRHNTAPNKSKESEFSLYTSFFNELISLSNEFLDKNITPYKRGKNKLFNYFPEYGVKEVGKLAKEITKTDWKFGLLEYKKRSDNSNNNVDNEMSFPLNALKKNANGEYEPQYNILTTNNKNYRNILPSSGVRVFNMSSFSPSLAATLKHRNSGKYIQSGPKLPTKMGRINGKYGPIDFQQSNMVQRDIHALCTEKPNYKVEQIIDFYHSKGVDVDSILSVLSMDPTQEHNGPMINQYIGVYGKWLMGQFYRGNLKIGDNKITKYLSKFHEYRRYMNEPVINSNITPEDLYSIVDNFKMRPEYNNEYMDDIHKARLSSNNRNAEYPYHMNINRPFGDDFDYSKLRDGKMIEDKACEMMAWTIMKVFDLKNTNDNITFLSIKSSSDYNERAIGNENKKNSIIWYLRNQFGINNKIESFPSFFQKTPERLFVTDSSDNEINGFEYRDIKNLNYSKLFFFCNKLFSENDNYRLNNLMYTNDEDDKEISDITEEGGALMDLEFISNQELDRNDEVVERTFYSEGIVEIVRKFQELYNKKKEGNLSKADKDEIKSYTVEIKTLTTTQKNNIKNLLTGELTDKEGISLLREMGTNGKIVVIDDNYATGKTLDMACFELVYTYKIPPQNIVAITPGWMAAKKDTRMTVKK